MVPLTTSQVALLDLAATVEGHIPRSVGFRTRSVPKASLEEYENILTALLLFGPGLSLATNVFTNKLEGWFTKHQLVEIVKCSEPSSNEERIINAYRRGFESWRDAELFAEQGRARITRAGNIRSPRIRLSGVLRSIEGDTRVNDANEFCIKYAGAAARSIDQLHSNAFTVSWVHFTNMVVNYNNNKHNFTSYSKNKTTKVNALIDDICENMCERMGLMEFPDRVRTEMMGDPFQFDYTPDDLERIWDREAILTQPSDSFAAHLKSSYLFGSRHSPVSFLAVHSFWRTLFEFQRLFDIASQNATPMIANPRVRRRANAEVPTVAMTTDLDSVRVYKIVCDFLPAIPRVCSIDSLLRLRDDSRLESLKSAMQEWLGAVDRGKGDLFKRISRDVDKATKGLRRAKRLERSSQVVNYVTIPISIAEALAGSCFGLLLLPVGPVLDLAAFRLKRRFSWLRFGLRDDE